MADVFKDRSQITSMLQLEEFQSAATGGKKWPETKLCKVIAFFASTISVECISIRIFDTKHQLSHNVFCVNNKRDYHFVMFR